MTREVELAWAAGFVDGEGCIGAYEYKGKKYARHCQLRLTIGQAERELLDRFQNIVQCGTVNGPYNNGHKGVYHFSVSGEKTREVMEALAPYLGSRKLGDYREALDKKLRFEREKKNGRRIGHLTE